MSVGEVGSRQSNRISLGGNISGTLQAAQMPALTGDITTVAGSYATTLATVNSNIGTFINATLTVNAKGLITAASSGSSPGNTFAVIDMPTYSMFGGA